MNSSSMGSLPSRSRTVEGWRARLAKEEEQAKAGVLGGGHRKLTDAEKRQLAGKYLKPGQRDEAGYARAIAKLSSVKVSAVAKKRLEVIKKKIDRIARMEDPELSKEEKKKEKHRWQQKLYREKNAERIREYSRERNREWRLKNKERFRESRARWRDKNRDHIRAVRKAWLKKNRAKQRAYNRQYVDRKRKALLEQKTRMAGGYLRRLLSQTDGRRYAVDVLKALLEAGFTSCRANHSTKVKYQADPLIRAWDELALRGNRKAAVGFCVMLTDMIGAKRAKLSGGLYESLEAFGKLREWPARH